VSHDQVLPPLNKAKEIANPDNDKEWVIIPMSFSAPAERKNLEGVTCIHYDAHVNTCVAKKAKESPQRLKALFNYFIMKF